MKSAEIRRRFVDYFVANGHAYVESSPTVPQGDPTLLFTNAGMNQFKGIFTGQEKRAFSRAVSVQKCVRAGGKHNDLENVGYTARHHTFFEMLGNFSFGDYFKREAIRFAWEFVTKELKMPVDRLHATVFREDDEAYGIWANEIGLPKERISRMGEKDNFWSMGETGPCGPCSELFFDRGANVGCRKSSCAVGCDCDRFTEFWNLVFMEFEQRADGTRVKLPKPSIDTGAGLERLSAILQGVESNYDTDLFSPILDRISSACGQAYAKASEVEKPSYRAVADHLRAMAFLINDGVVPSKDGRGYVLRRIMRRAMRHGAKIGLRGEFLADLCDAVIDSMSPAYPELAKNRGAIQKIVTEEERQFAKTIHTGMAYLSTEVQKLKASKKSTLPGDVAFRLYDTYGFPIDLTQDVLREQGLSLDQEGFDESFDRHREKARGSWKGSQKSALDALFGEWSRAGLSTEFVGYGSLRSSGKVLKIVSDGKEISSASEGQAVEVLADRTPFYGESGGQVGDIGTASGTDGTLEILDTQKAGSGWVIHQARVSEGTIRVGESLDFLVDAKARAATAKNHSATHLLHAALLEILGEHVVQKGSLVSPERLRFDFAHPKAVSEEEVRRIEEAVNDRVWANLSVAKEEMPIERARLTGAKMLFGEKYGESVRVVTMGEYSKELCGGTHLDRTGEIGLFKIVRESSVASGIRRIEAYTSHRALRFVAQLDERMRRMSALLGVSSDAVAERLEQILAQQKEKKKGAEISPADPRIESIHGISFASLILDGADPKSLRELADRALEKIRTGVVVVATSHEGRASMVVKVSKDRAENLSAAALVREVAPILGGSGGGKPDMAQVGGTEVANLPQAIDFIRSKLSEAT